MVNGGEIMMDGGGKIGNSSNGQLRWHNGWQDSKEVAMGNGMAVARWMSQ
jgi:hypothetical protein